MPSPMLMAGGKRATGPILESTGLKSTSGFARVSQKMFTGIVTDVGTIRSVENRADLRVTVGTAFDLESVDLGASIACSGACLTVVDKGDEWFAVDLSAETVSKTAADHWREGAR